MTAIIEGHTEPLDPFQLPGELLGEHVRCLCLCECPQHVPQPLAVATYGLVLVAVALASWAVGRVQRIRRRVRL